MNTPKLRSLSRTENGMASPISDEDLRYATGCYRYFPGNYEAGEHGGSITCKGPSGRELMICRDGVVYASGVKVASYQGASERG